MTKNAMRWTLMLASGAAMLQLGGCLNGFWQGAVQGVDNPWWNIAQDVVIETFNLGVGNFLGAIQLPA